MRHIAIVCINSLTLRYIAETPVLEELAQVGDQAEITLISSALKDQAYIEKMGKKHLHWARLSQPTADLSALPPRSFWQRAKGAIYRLLKRSLFRNRAEYANLYYRFSEINQFSRFIERKRYSAEKKAYEERRGVFLNERYGFPFANSRWLFRLLYRFHYAPWQINDGYVEAFFEQNKFDLLVLVHIQNPLIKPYVLAAHKRGIPMLGIVSSWDQPTLGGCIVPGIQHYLVANAMMRDHLTRYHHIPAEKIEVIGWTQNDYFHDPSVLQTRGDFLASQGIEPQRRLLLWASYPVNWVAYEPSILGHVIHQTQAGAYGDDFTLIIRPHPIDPDAARLKQYHQPPFILVEEPELGNLTHLINLLRHVAVIIAPASTITLDAAAADTPIINIAFDGDASIDEAESCKHWYTSDHYREVVQTGGITLVDSYTALDQAILDYLQNPQHNANGRAKMRAYLIEPFDGKSAKRLVARLLTAS